MNASIKYYQDKITEWSCELAELEGQLAQIDQEDVALVNSGITPAKRFFGTKHIKAQISLYQSKIVQAKRALANRAKVIKAWHERQLWLNTNIEQLSHDIKESETEQLRLTTLLEHGASLAQTEIDFLLAFSSINRKIKLRNRLQLEQQKHMRYKPRESMAYATDIFKALEDMDIPTQEGSSAARAETECENVLTNASELSQIVDKGQDYSQSMETDCDYCQGYGCLRCVQTKTGE